MNDAWLNGWKQIAAFMGCSVDTAKRYKKRFGLPVKYLPSGRPAAVKEELQMWLCKSNEESR